MPNLQVFDQNTDLFHASLGIRPDQYQVVHDNLMWAIVDVLG